MSCFVVHRDSTSGQCDADITVAQSGAVLLLGPRRPAAPCRVPADRRMRARSFDESLGGGINSARWTQLGGGTPGEATTCQIRQIPTRMCIA